MDDMVAEILEIVRAEANRRQSETRRVRTTTPLGISVAGITLPEVGTIRASVQRQQKFLGEVIEHASVWEREGDELRIIFSPEKRAFAELLTGRDPLNRLTAVVREVLGTPVRVQVVSGASVLAQSAS